jgi:hypothetical protein
MESMDQEEIRAALNRHWSASAEGDQNSEHEIYADDIICDYPQSGERIRGRRNLQALRSHQSRQALGFSGPQAFGIRQSLDHGIHDHVPGASRLHGQHHGIQQRQGSARNTVFRRSFRGPGVARPMGGARDDEAAGVNRRPLSPPNVLSESSHKSDSRHRNGTPVPSSPRDSRANRRTPTHRRHRY